jgi:arylsulfatase A-like enzyme
VPENVSTIDLLPTLRALGGVAPGAQDRGVDLSSALRGGALDAERPLFAMRVNELRERPLWRRAVIRGSREYIWSVPRDRRELYDLIADPAETHDLAADAPDTVDALHAILTRELETAPTFPRAFAPERELDPELAERLRALGYAN